MSRFILVIELVLGVIVLSVFWSGTSPFLYLAAAPFILVLAFPILSILAVWDIKDILQAIRDVSNPRSFAIWSFGEKMAYLGGFIGLAIGGGIFLTGIGQMSLEQIHLKGKQAALSAAYGLLAGIILNLLSGISSKIEPLPMPVIPEEALRIFSSVHAITRREVEVIRMVAAGKSNKDISITLFISEDTVKNHLYNIFQKTGIKSRSELVSRVLLKQSE